LVIVSLAWHGKVLVKISQHRVNPDRATLGFAKLWVDSSGFGNCARRVMQALARHTIISKH
jgi:hypothetical protein